MKYGGIVLTLFAFLLSEALGQDFIPLIDSVARVKEHRQGRDGTLVPGEEHMRKIIIQWSPIPGADAYEVCHNCVLGGEEELTSGSVDQADMEIQRAGRPAYIKKDTTFGVNTFRVRAHVGGKGWSQWSDEKRFLVGDPGEAIHDEL